MRMLNANGSEGMMCGNAIRCVGKYFFENIDSTKTTITTKTASGIKRRYGGQGGVGTAWAGSVHLVLGQHALQVSGLPERSACEQDAFAPRLPLLDMRGEGPKYALLLP